MHFGKINFSTARERPSNTCGYGQFCSKIAQDFHLKPTLTSKMKPNSANIDSDNYPILNILNKVSFEKKSWFYLQNWPSNSQLCSNGEKFWTSTI